MKKLTDAQCETRWETATKKNPIIVDSEEGIQVMAWLDRRVKNYGNDKIHDQKTGIN